MVLQLLFIADVSRRRVHLPEQERSKPARQAVTFLLICNVTMWLIYTFEAQKVLANPVSTYEYYLRKVLSLPETLSEACSLIIIISLLQSTALRRPPPGYATRLDLVSAI